MRKVAAVCSLPRRWHQGSITLRWIQGHVTEGVHRRVAANSSELTNRRTPPSFSPQGTWGGPAVLRAWSGPVRSIAVGRFSAETAWMSSSSTEPPPKNASSTKEATRADTEETFRESGESTTKVKKSSPLGPMHSDFKGYSLKWNAVQALSNKTLFVLWCLKQDDAEPPFFVAENLPNSEIQVTVFRQGKPVGVGQASQRLRAEAKAAGDALAKFSPDFARKELETVEKIQLERRNVLERKPTAYNAFMRSEIPKIKDANPKLRPHEIVIACAKRWKELKANNELRKQKPKKDAAPDAE